MTMRLGFGCDLEAPMTPDGRTLAWIAAHEGDVEVLERLVSEDVDLAAGSKEGNSPLHAAAARDHGEAVDKLVRWGLAVDALTTDFPARGGAGT